MKKFILKLAGFVCILSVSFLLLVVATIGLNKVSKNTCNLDDDIRYIVLGDSHTMWSIDDSDIDGLRNLSLNAEGYRYSYLKFQYLINEGYHFDKVYIGFGYHNLSGYYDEYITGMNFKYFIDRYLSVLTFSDYKRLASEGLLSFLSTARYIVKNGWKGPVKGECKLFGQFPDEHMIGEFNIESMENRISEQFYFNGEVWGVSSNNREYLTKLIDLVQKENSEVIILNTPVYTLYKSRVPVRYLTLYKDFLSANNLQSYDFQDLKLDSNQYLPDGDHVNFYGAEAVTSAFRRYHEAQ